MIVRTGMIGIVVMLAWCPWDSLWAQERPATQEVRPDPQLEINREALISKGFSERNRINAAMQMLVNPDPEARKILLDGLAQSDNPAAQAAICKALGQIRTDTNPLPNPEDFLQPLLGILAGQDVMVARLAAEAALMFRYDMIGKYLEQLVSKDPTKPVSTRLNGIYALKLQPDMAAAKTLVGLVDDPDKQVATQATEALHAIGIPASKDPEDRKIINELKWKSKEEFLRDWVVRQEERMREERERVREEQERIGALWKLLLQTMDRLYATFQDDVERAKFLAEHLKSQQTERRLWALDKIYQWRVAGKPMPPEIVPTLIGLIGDGDKNVRLETAKLLAIMGEVSSPEKLLAQLEVEQEEDVKAGLFLALGVACDYALSSDSGPQMTPDIKIKTLGWADRFLSQQDPNEARDGAVVIRKLIEKNGLAAREVDKYLGRLELRFRQASLVDATLRSELVGVMASLCSSPSACKEAAQKRFESIFEMARSEENDKVREQAVEGFISIDKTSALKKFRQGAIDDRSPKIRKRLIDLASEVGGQEDLEWLAGRVGPNNPDGDAVWKAMLDVFARCDTTILQRWLVKFKSGDLRSRLSSEQWRAFLQLAERKAGGQTDMMQQVLEELVAYHRQKGDLEGEAGYLVKLIAMIKDEQKDLLLSQLLAIYLKQSKVEQAAQLIQTTVDKRDPPPQDPLLRIIEEYVTQQSDKLKHTRIIETVLKKVIVKDPRPNWDQFRQRWIDSQGKTLEPSQVDQTSN